MKHTHSRALAGILATTLGAAGLVAAGAPALATSAAPTALYGFEDAASIAASDDSTDGVIGVTRAMSGISGLDAASGCFYAIAAQNLDDGDYAYQFTRFGGYGDTFPAGGWTASADFYLDVDVATGGSLDQFDWSVAANGSDGAHQRDYIFHAQSAGAGSWTIGASNNSGFVGVGASPLTGDTLTVTESGWYTFAHDFRDEAGVLAVDMTVLDADGVELASWTRTSPADTIPDAVGANRYGWITVNGFEQLPIDNVLMNAERPSEGCQPFVDVTGVEGAAGYSEHELAIRWMALSGLSKGWTTPGGQEFRPLAQTTRDAFAAFLWRQSGSPEPTLTASPFADVSGDPSSPLYNEHWKAIFWMSETGLADGWADGTYRPLSPVKRDAIAAFLYRLAGSPALATSSSPFSDVALSDTSIEHRVAIVWMHEAGLSTGWSDGTYRPFTATKRDALAAFLFRRSMTI
ncbi:S-layer homology domain-containing protein [Demequina sp. SYSU T00039]|uniref:S-layer homology domain-containing protein n=1 Tax=Demequina lignilytica TaxID=3051663 RepID=A0AAW7M8V2_9MICO|nr:MULTISPECIES: S-layer homology domain-containing protein [unclassified Demequina]MDN4477183.1 S-layer homology domain-containing protein [Demequina sp. SYSU T00039-1]MDN4487356.1 S-layer homology domain-containing protein [Demequina sp. SYSU T00039]MDN4491109.1 S-layer homology domain-containing protein [Demequina sp. SYSU T00068]